MEYYVELKLRGDAHPDGFANGMSLCRSQSSRSLEKVSETDAETVYKNPHNTYEFVIVISFAKTLA